MANPLDKLNLTPEQRARFSDELRRLRKTVGRARADQFFNRAAKVLEMSQGLSAAEARRRYNIGGRDPRVVAAYSKQLSELAKTASEIDFDRAAQMGELAKKQVDLMTPMLNIIGRAVTGEAQFATGVGQARIRGLSDQYKEYNEALTRKLSTLSSDPNSDTKRKTIPNAVATVFEVGNGAQVNDLNELARTESFLNAVNTSLNKVSLPGDTIEMFEGISAQYGGPAAFQALLQNSKAAEAKTIIRKLNAAKQGQDKVYKEHGKKVTGLIQEASKALGARRPQLAKVINEVATTLGGLDGTRSAKQALDNALAALTPKKGEVSPIQQERERLLKALANEDDNRGPIEAARDQFWATPEFGEFVRGVTKGKTVADFSRPELVQLTKVAQRYQRRAAKGNKTELNDLIREFETGEEIGKSTEKRVLPDEPETEAGQRPSADIVQPPAVTDTVPETEDVADYDSVQSNFKGEPAEIRLKQQGDSFVLEIVKDGKVSEIIDQGAEDFDTTMTAFMKAAEFVEEAGEQPSGLFGITPEEATEKATKEFGQMEYDAQEDRFQRDLPDNPFGDFEDDFAKQAQQVEGLTPPPSAPLTTGAPILSATVDDISPTEKQPDYEAELSRRSQTAALRSQMDDILSGEMGEDPLTTQQSMNLDSDERIRRTAEAMRRRLQRVEAGTGR